MSKKEINIWRTLKIIYDYLLPINFFGCIFYILWLLVITGWQKSFAALTIMHFVGLAAFIIVFPVLNLIGHSLEKKLDTERNKHNDRENE